MQYVAYWNLTESPFQNVADTRFAYLSDQHHEGLARLMYLVSNRKLGGVLTGPYGVGKSMVLQLLAEHVQKEGKSRFVGLDYLPGPIVVLARQILAMLDFKAAAESLQNEMEAIRLLREKQSSLEHTVIAIDEAQMINEPGTYHFLHLLTNVSIHNRDGRPTSSAFTLILSGYSDLTRLIATDASLCQRLQMVWSLDPLNARQSIEYIQHRMRTAGGDLWAFDEASLHLAHEGSGGIPRVMNNLCDVALMLGCASGVRHVGADLMSQAIRDVRSPLLARAPAEEEA